MKLRIYAGEELEVLGAIAVSVVYQAQEEQLRLLVVAGNGPSLLGRDWLTKNKIDWRELYQVCLSSLTLQEVLQQHTEVFKNELVTVRGAAAKDPRGPSSGIQNVSAKSGTVCPTRKGGSWW